MSTNGIRGHRVGVAHADEHVTHERERGSVEITPIGDHDQIGHLVEVLHHDCAHRRTIDSDGPPALGGKPASCLLRRRTGRNIHHP
jgi:hypothetical protein